MKKALLGLEISLIAFVVIVMAGYFTACTTTDKTSAAVVQSANAAADGYYEFYALTTNAHPEKASAMLPGLKQVMGAQQSLGLSSYNYKVISAMYKTNVALKGSVTAALLGVNQNKSNLLF